MFAEFFIRFVGFFTVFNLYNYIIPRLFYL